MAFLIPSRRKGLDKFKRKLLHRAPAQARNIRQKVGPISMHGARAGQWRHTDFRSKLYAGL